MSHIIPTSRMNTSARLSKLFYKYTEEKTEEAKPPEDAKPLEEVSKVPAPKDLESYAPFNFSWFIENKIAACGWPQTVSNLNYLADVGVNHLVTLSPEKLPPILECEKKMRWSEVPIKEFGAPSLKQILKFIEICERTELRGEVLGVHCRQGRGRTGTMLACYLVYFKQMAPERAVLTVRVMRPGSCETYEQEKVVCHYHDCLRGTVPKPDYRLVDEKDYFDSTMRHLEEETKGGDEIQDGEENQDGADEKKDGGEEPKKKAPRKKSNAMVINHKIYF